MRSRRMRLAVLAAVGAVGLALSALLSSRPAIAVPAGLCGFFGGVIPGLQSRPAWRLYWIPTLLGVAAIVVAVVGRHHGPRWVFALLSGLAIALGMTLWWARALIPSLQEQRGPTRTARPTPPKSRR